MSFFYVTDQGTLTKDFIQRREIGGSQFLKLCMSTDFNMELQWIGHYSNPANATHSNMWVPMLRIQPKAAKQQTVKQSGFKGRVSHEAFSLSQFSHGQ